MMDIEYRELGELEGRTLIGLALPFHDPGISSVTGIPEIALPGSLDVPVTVELRHEHDGPRIGTAEVYETAAGYEMRAALDADGSDRFRGGRLSIGFRALAESMRNGVRRLEKIALDHIAVVANPAYTGAVITETRDKEPEPMDEEETTEETTAVVDPATAVVDPTPAASTELMELRDQLAELNRTIAAAPWRTREVPMTERKLPEVRTAGEWMYHAARATAAFDWVTPTEQALSLEKLGGSETEIRAVTSTPSSGLGAAIPDQYLGPIEALYRAGRPFINALGSQPLPSAGLDIHRPVVTQGSLVAWESSEGDEPSSQAVTISDVTGALKALKSAMKGTLQTALRSSPSAVDAMLRDQAAAMGTELNTAAINGDGTITASTGTLAGVLDNGSITTGTAIDTSYTSTKLLASLTNAFVTILTTIPGASMQEIFITMAPRRWGDTLALEDGSNRPIFNISSDPAQNTLGEGTPVAGTIMGVPVVVDDSIPENLGVGTNQDTIIVASRRAFELFEGSRMVASWQDPATFQTTYGSAVMAALLPIYPAGLVAITGSGLT